MQYILLLLTKRIADMLSRPWHVEKVFYVKNL